MKGLFAGLLLLSAVAGKALSIALGDTTPGKDIGLLAWVGAVERLLRSEAISREPPPNFA